MILETLKDNQGSTARKLKWKYWILDQMKNFKNQFQKEVFHFCKKEVLCQKNLDSTDLELKFSEIVFILKYTIITNL